MNIFKKILKTWRQYILSLKQIIKQKDFDRILDHILVWSVIFSFLFVVIYKVFIHLEVYFFDTNVIVLPNEIKNNLVFVYFVFLCIWILSKLYLYFRIGTKAVISPIQKDENKILHFRIFNKELSISTSTLYILVLIFILFVSIFIKIKFFDLPFVGSHPMKYNTYAEPALHMVENNDPLFFRRNYMYNPLKPSEASAQVFGNLPLLEWILYISYSIGEKFLSIETITRLVTSILGAIALGSFYYFVSNLINKKIALATTLLLCFNPIFNLASYVTVYDILTLTFTFISLTFILKFIKNGEFKNLTIAGLIIGIASSIKTNILVWELPTILVMFISQYRKSFKNIILWLFYLCLWITIPILIVQTSVTYFPSKEIIDFILFFISLFIATFLFTKQSQIAKTLSLIFDKAFVFFKRYKILYILPILLVLLVVYFVYQSNLSEEFLTDSQLVFNSDLYRYMLENQLIPYIGIYLSIITIYSFPFIFRLNDRLIRWVILALLVGVISYTALASKVLFFHNYYWVTILPPIYLLATLGIFYLGNIVKNEKVRKFFIITMLMIQVLLLLPYTTSKINRDDKDIKNIITYFNSQNIEDGVSYIDEASTSYILFKTNLNIIYGYEIFDNQDLHQKVRDEGLIETMRDYKILYIITPTGNTPNYLPIANAYDFNNELVENSIRRTDKILDTLNGTDTYYPHLDEREEIIKKYHIDETYYPTAQFGKYTIWELSRICFDVDK